MLSIDKLKEEQVRLSKKLILKDDFRSIGTAAGVENIFVEQDIICSIVLCDYKTMDLKEEVYTIMNVDMPYISGFRAYREGKAVTETFLKLKEKPSVMMFGGNGILHPRRLGLASHMGILLDIPTLGVAKQRLCGDVKDNKVILDGKTIGEVVYTKEHSKPLFVSQGHRISLKTSVDIVKKSVRLPHKLPEPLHLAHKQANKVKEMIFSGEIKA